MSDDGKTVWAYDSDARDYPSAPVIAESIRVTRHGSTCSLEIDGVEFPYYVAEDGVRLSVNPGEVPSVRLTILALRVEVTDALSEKDEE